MNTVANLAQTTLLMIGFTHGCRKSLISQDSDLGRLSLWGLFERMEWRYQLFRGRHLLPGNRLSAKHEVPSVEPLYIGEAQDLIRTRKRPCRDLAHHADWDAVLHSP